jgi:L-alanine-DL-glutamate epimerase-like enolase superfamily enzyme
MALIKTIDTGLYRIPLTISLSDSTHGKITAFELITCRVRDSDGAEGVGYTYTVGRNGGAIADTLRREIPELIEGREADDTEAIWHHVWWPCTTAAAADRPCSHCRRSISPCGT